MNENLIYLLIHMNIQVTGQVKQLNLRVKRLRKHIIL